MEIRGGAGGDEAALLQVISSICTSVIAIKKVGNYL